MTKGKTWEQYKPECEAVAKPGITVLGWVGEWKGNTTLLKCSCVKHGEWASTTINSFKKGTSCPSCRGDKIRSLKLHPTTLHINAFMATGKFKVGTKFWRSEKANSYGRKTLWCYTCPTCSSDEYVQAGVCSGVFESTLADLKKGKTACRCQKSHRLSKRQWEFKLQRLCKERGYDFEDWVNASKWGTKEKFFYTCRLHGLQKITPDCFMRGQECSVCAGNNQRECYLNIVFDKELPVALKFGIAKDSSTRLQSQNRVNLFEMQHCAIYRFSSVEDCKAAEKTCMSELTCGILSSRELVDGWTETVALADYDKVISIYERFGGVRVDTLTKEGSSGSKD